MPKAGSSKRAMQRSANRRKVLPGFPSEHMLRSKEEIEEYFGGDRIQCLLCGKWFKRLGGHLKRIHGVTQDEYRKRYGLPWRRGLTSKEAHKNYSEATKKHFRDPEYHLEHLRFLQKGRDKMKQHPPLHRDKAPYIKKEMTKRILLHTNDGVQYTEENFYDFLRTMVEKKLSPDETSKLKNMPSLSWIYSFKKKDERYDKHFHDAINSLHVVCNQRQKAVDK